MGFIWADKDPSARGRRGAGIRERRRVNDLAFLERLRSATADELDRMFWESERFPLWRQIAIARAIARKGVE